MSTKDEMIPLSLSFSQLLTAVKLLTPEEKYILGSELWREFDPLDNDFLVSESDQKIILERADEMDKDPTVSTTWDEVKMKLRDKYDF